MLEEEATVVSTTVGSACVALAKTEACSHCAAASLCHPVGEKVMQISVANPAGAGPGDRVIISLPEGALLSASAKAYLLPAMILVAGAAVGWSITRTDAGALAGAAVGLAAAAAVVVLLSRGRTLAEPAITRVISKARSKGESPA